MQITGEVPVARFRAGQVSGALRENEIKVDGEAKTILKCSVQRRYTDKNGEWRSSQSFSRNEIPLAIYCPQKAFEAIIAKDGERSNAATDKVPVETVR